MIIYYVTNIIIFVIVVFHHYEFSASAMAFESQEQFQFVNNTPKSSKLHAFASSNLVCHR